MPDPLQELHERRIRHNSTMRLLHKWNRRLWEVGKSADRKREQDHAWEV